MALKLEEIQLEDTRVYEIRSALLKGIVKSTLVRHLFNLLLFIAKSVRILGVWRQYTSSKLKEYRSTRIARGHYREILLRTALQHWEEYLVHRRTDRVSIW